MSPTSLSLQVTTVVLAVTLAVATGLGWERARGWWRWPTRFLALLCCVVTAFSVAGVAVNRKLHMYTAWGQFAGDNRAPADPQPVFETAGGGSSAGRLVTVTITGRRSGIELPAYVYLPPSYDSSTARLPVLEAFAGFPGTPQTWFDVADPREVVEREIKAGRMPPTVVVFPVQHASPTRDSECVDAAGGAQFATYLSLDVQDYIGAHFRVRTDRAGWGLIGFSTGGFCAANLALRHPDRYAAAVSMAGYFTAITDGTTGDLYRGDSRLRDENSPLWRIENLPVPALALYLACARDDVKGFAQLQAMAAAARSPLKLTTAVVPDGGHTGAAWKAMTPAALDWLSAQLGGPAVDAPADHGPAGNPAAEGRSGLAPATGVHPPLPPRNRRPTPAASHRRV
ncbi:alpha/beta hydrolase [Planosporangium mesophilum]|uniref:Esterase n=1 Tax=Planosporangium mesophilum TaxID=689768 RepID=A0A8J3TGY2_9ACTN|nr:alpha/beta hydrolase-fold protein [Planosporangium mesophilum]NJC85609.1 esterase family protein [Planosporangium mesophilum]GII24524.1 esterase [Planosporangium mesophilum]